MVKTNKSLLGFLWFFFFITVISAFGLWEYHTHRSSKIASLEQENQQLENTNHVISSKLEATQDSLNIALSRDVLWLSRVTYSETRKPLEMYYISHVVKNRVETCYNGKCSYKEVALDPYEFSAFNPNRPLRTYYKNVDRYSTGDPGGWAAAKQVAFKTYMRNYDPTNGGTHFFAQISMKNHRFPDWAHYGERVTLANNVDKNRLRVYKNVR